MCAAADQELPGYRAANYTCAAAFESVGVVSPFALPDRNRRRGDVFRGRNWGSLVALAPILGIGFPQELARTGGVTSET